MEAMAPHCQPSGWLPPSVLLCPVPPAAGNNHIAVSRGCHNYVSCVLLQLSQLREEQLAWQVELAPVVAVQDYHCWVGWMVRHRADICWATVSWRLECRFCAPLYFPWPDWSEMVSVPRVMVAFTTSTQALQRVSRSKPMMQSSRTRVPAPSLRPWRVAWDLRGGTLTRPLLPG